ncbi:XS domain-containing protein [Artemisia annua]|uniref:XS domain-containing protein n=1 Tax=Artemisia annua TaxID=35608 RepID=A0A2U1PR24_ARTAN|nr:XS domain-containing protein [Artemisia annua]
MLLERDGDSVIAPVLSFFCFVTCARFSVGMLDEEMSTDKGKGVAEFSDFDMDQLNQVVQDVNLGSNDEGGWEVYSKKNKNKGGIVAAASIQAPKPTPWGQPDALRPAGRGGAPVRPPTNVWANPAGGRGGAINYNPAPNAVPPPLQSGWNWNSRPNNPPARRANMGIPQPPAINEPTRQWHCPACQNGPGAIDWYKSLQSLVTHARTKGSKRVKIHRDLAELLEEELRIRGALVVPAGESYGKWKGLNEVVKDREIVWPPSVVIMNTQLEQDENERWLGMGNQELLDYFGSYQAVRARHAYGPRGHRGMSLLIFEASAVGYTEAERLSKHFEHQGTDRAAWDHRPQLFYPGGKRQLFGYMATKRDMDIFNQHSQGKSKLKFEMVSYQEKVVNQLKQMNEDNQQLNWYKNKVAKEQMHSKALEESFGLVSQKLRKTEEENRQVRERTKQLHDQNKEEMDYQEQFFKDHLKVIQDSRTEKEDRFDKLLQEARIHVDQVYSAKDPQMRDEKLEEMEEFEKEREKLMKLHEERMVEMKNRHWREVIEMEAGHNTVLSQLRAKYTPKWLGMGNQELLDYFGSYQAVRARHAYGPRGHRGMSLLIFEASAVGYTEAERLSKHFEHQGTDRAAWDHRPQLFYPGGKRQLFGYMATKRDMDIFNQHSQGKSKLKFEMVSYQEKVVNQLKQMNEDNQQLNWYKNKVAKEQMHSKALEESFGLVSQKLRKTEEENRQVRERTKQLHDQNKEEMDYQEQFFKDHLKVIQDSRTEKEDRFDKLLQEARIHVDQVYSAKDPQMRDEKLEEMEEFEKEREKLMKLHEERMVEMKNRHWREVIEMEAGHNTVLSQLRAKYTPKV